MSNVLSIDIGGSKVVVAIVDEGGSIVKSEKRLLPDKYDATYLMDFVLEMINPFLSYNPVAVGVAIPGLADSINGVWKYAPFSGVAEIPVAKIITEKTGLKCYIENDVNICAVGERVYGNCKNVDDFLWVTVSNGVGGALFLNGKLYVGEHNNAGEIGHFYIGNKSYRCGCGKVGCLETYASGQGIQREYKKLTGESLKADNIAKMALNGDKTAKSVYNRAGYSIGKAVAYVVNLLNFDNVILGGGVAQSYELLAPSIQKALKKYLFVQAHSNVTIKVTGLGYYASIKGAAAYARLNIKE